MREHAAAFHHAAISIVIPTRNERDNVAPLLRRLDAVAPSGSEVLFVDDSDDDTVARIHAAASRQRHLVVHADHRPIGSRAGGLGSAVVRGMERARHPVVCVMDADLQHPPETLTALVEAHLASGSDCVVATRYRCDGNAEGLASAVRASVSRACNLLARALFPRRLRAVSDPMSGMFLLVRDAIDFSHLRPDGFKLLFEILAVTPDLRVSEVGYRFADRYTGASKAGVQEGMRFMNRIIRLRCSRRTWSGDKVPDVQTAPDGAVGQ